VPVTKSVENKCQIWRSSSGETEPLCCRSFGLIFIFRVESIIYFSVTGAEGNLVYHAAGDDIGVAFTENIFATVHQQRAFPGGDDRPLIPVRVRGEGKLAVSADKINCAAARGTDIDRKTGNSVIHCHQIIQQTLREETVFAHGLFCRNVVRHKAFSVAKSLTYFLTKSVVSILERIEGERIYFGGVNLAVCV